MDAAWTPKPHRGEGGVRTGPWAVRLPTVAEVGARVGAHGDPRPATSRSGPGRLPAPGPAVARCVTRAFPAEYCLSLAQPQPDAGEREQGLVSTGRKGIGQEKEKKKKKTVEDVWNHPATEHGRSGGEAGNPERQPRVRGALPHPAPSLNPTGRMLRTSLESPKPRRNKRGADAELRDHLLPRPSPPQYLHRGASPHGGVGEGLRGPAPLRAAPPSSASERTLGYWTSPPPSPQTLVSRGSAAGCQVGRTSRRAGFPAESDVTAAPAV